MTQSWLWIEPDGTVQNLMNIGFIAVLDGPNGLWMPPIALNEDVIPLQPGAKVRHVNVKSRPIHLPVLIQGSTPAQLEINKRTIMRWFDPRRGDGRLRLTGEDGSQRELICRYAGGLEGDESGRKGGATWQNSIITLQASDPFWYDVSDSTLSFVLAAAVTAFFPIFPVLLTASTVFASSIVNNDGQAEAWPRWVIQGPGKDPILTNNTTGKKLALSRTLTGSDSITVDARPTIKTVVDQSGSNMFPNLSVQSELWPLEQGANDISVELPGADVASSVTLVWRRRWLGP